MTEEQKLKALINERNTKNARIALAAAEWREHRASGGHHIECGCEECQQRACDVGMLDAILRGEGPAHNPPNRGPDGQKPTEGG